MTRRWLSLLVSASLAACASEEIVLVESGALGQAERDAGGEGFPDCERFDDCIDDRRCDRRADDGDDRCRPSPRSCPDELDPACGSDGVIYFNDCLRDAHGVAPCDLLSQPRSCGEAGDEACPNGGLCARLRAGAPSFFLAGLVSGSGACWVLPERCDGPSELSWLPMDDPESERCVGTCQAIRSQRPHSFAGRAVCAP